MAMHESVDKQPRIAPISLDAATGKSKELLDELASRAGAPGPMGRTMANAPALLRKLGIADCFDYIADAGRIVRAKPDPAIFLDVAAALGVPAHLCIGVEDAAAGVVREEGLSLGAEAVAFVVGGHEVACARAVACGVPAVGDRAGGRGPRLQAA